MVVNSKLKQPYNHFLQSYKVTQKWWKNKQLQLKFSSISSINLIKFHKRSYTLMVLWFWMFSTLGSFDDQSSSCNLDYPWDQVLTEQDSRNPSQFFGDTSTTSSSSAPLLEDLSLSAYPKQEWLKIKYIKCLVFFRYIVSILLRNKLP